MNQNCEIKADSISAVDGSRLTSILFKRFPYRLIQEIGTHRSLNPFGIEFSRSSASSRAIPVEKVIESIKADPYIPAWTRNQKGMQGGEIEAESVQHLNMLHHNAMQNAFVLAREAARLGAHKQEVNGYLMPFMRVSVLATGHQKAWQNFFELRCHETAHPDFQEQASSAKELYLDSPSKLLCHGDWHVPFYGGGEKVSEKWQFTYLLAAAANCARLSYESHDGDHSVASQFDLALRLINNKHASPFEHIAMCSKKADIESSRNFQPYGWLQLRHLVFDADLDKFGKIA